MGLRTSARCGSGWALSARKKLVSRVGSSGHAVQQLWKLEETRKLLLGTSLCLAINLGELLFNVIRPCVMSSALYSSQCGDSMLAVQVLSIIKVASMVALVTHTCNPRLVLAGSEQLGFSLPKGLAQAKNRGWAAASSEEVFRELVQVTRQSQLQLILFLALGIMVPTASFVAADIASARSPEYRIWFEQICPGCFEDKALESIAFRWRATLAIAVASLSSYSNSLVLILRLEMWSPVFIEAVKKVNVVWLRRSMYTYLFQMMVGPLTVYVFAIGVKIKLMTATRSEMAAFLWVSLATLLVNLMYMAWTLGLDVAVVRAVSRRPAGPQHTASSTHEDSDKLALVTSSRSAASQSTSKTLRQVSEAGFKTRQLHIMVNFTLLLVNTPHASWWTFAAVWVCRLITIAGILMTRDKPYTMDELQESEPGFGLVVDSSHLRAAIRTWLAGETYTGPLLKTRGSYFCMDDTLTVSYRWQGEEAEICPGLRLNMSRWQLAELEKAISNSSCIYVWIDKVALPQDGCKLQRTLLARLNDRMPLRARMMAVYASSRVTLAMRSLEQDQSRYHQRAWTLQELCNAREVQIVTQAIPEGAEESGLLAVTPKEASDFLDARKWHQRRAAQCRPYWLSGFRVADLESSFDYYGRIATQVFCKYKEDKVRALYPLIFNTPCENESEMLDLVLDVSMSKSSMSESCMMTQSRFDVARQARSTAELAEDMPEEARAFVASVKSKGQRAGQIEADDCADGDEEVRAITTEPMNIRPLPVASANTAEFDGMQLPGAVSSAGRTF
eukprot:scaffold7909_cov36-Prasinocladus_malaysianus.AAC.1